jgi:two-component system, chemotaxis family, protein-glutamate methylesterase/glutaminase
VHAVAAGALAMVPRPAGIGHPDHAESTRRLIEMVKLMSEVRVVRRWSRKRPSRAPMAAAAVPTRMPAIQAVAIGASTGGPLVLQSILSRLPKDVAMPPLLIVQHMAQGFVQGFAEWLTQSTGFPVRIAQDGEAPAPGHAYVAPDDVHMGVRADGRILLSRDRAENGLRPAVSFLFRSLEATLAPHVVAVMLTGMGRDGVDELKRLKDAGALTIAQDEETSVVFGMPGQAVAAGAVSHVLAPEGIASTLASLVNHQ